MSQHQSSKSFNRTVKATEIVSSCPVYMKVKKETTDTKIGADVHSAENMSWLIRANEPEGYSIMHDNYLID